MNTELRVKTYAVTVQVVATRTVYVEASFEDEARRLAMAGPEVWFDADALSAEGEVLSAGPARAIDSPSDMGRPSEE